MSLLRNIFFLSLILLLFSCTKGEFIEPEAIHHQQIDSLFGAKDKTPLSLDINNDGIADLEFFAENYSSDESTKEAFLVKGLNGTQILLVNNTYNALFQCRDLSAMIEGELISGSTTSSNSWDSRNGILISRLLSRGETYNGPLTDEKSKILAVKILKSDKEYYGWVRLGFDRSTVKLMVLEFAANKVAGKPIKAGSTVIN